MNSSNDELRIDKQAYRAMNGTQIRPEAAQVARQQVLERIEKACRDCQRDPSSVQLLAVSKTFGFESVLAMADAGQRTFGENYLQEALDKQAAIKNERPDLALEWHFIGPIQSNKTRPIAEHFDWVHTLDREKTARRLSEQRPDHLPGLNVCIQVNIDDEASKSGCTPEQAISLATMVATLPRLQLKGLMAIPAPTPDPKKQQAAFQAVKELFDEVQAAVSASTPDQATRLDTLSIGMTADLESAISRGATIVRIGTALFGQRQKRA